MTVITLEIGPTEEVLVDAYEYMIQLKMTSGDEMVDLSLNQRDALALAAVLTHQAGVVVA